MNNSLTSTGTNPPFVWVSSSTTRGTFQIFSLCASTTVICIWSAVHRDIPPRRLTGSRSYALQATWVFYALFLPEFVFVYALKQFLDARRLVDRFNKHSDAKCKTRWFLFWRKCENKKDSGLEDKESLINHKSKTNGSTPPTLVHAFYALMGGYVFDVDVSTSDTQPESRNNERIRATIELAGIQFLMKHDPDIIPIPPVTSITDRSKSNGLNKALLIAQLTWFCTSCISRLISRLPLTLLEVVTAAHGLCTLATYAAWWHKPLNVEEPTVVMGERAREACAFLTMVHNEKIKPLKEEARSASTADRDTNFQANLALALRAANRYAISDEELENLSREFLVVSPPTETESTIKTALNLLDQLLSASSLSGSGRFSSTVSAVWTSLTSVYGLVHLFGWNAQFPTMVERILWRIATVAICSCGACFSVSALYAAFLDDAAKLHNTLKPFLVFVKYFFCISAVIIIPPFYLLSTLYILVESIRQLFYLPPEAFVVASWSNYFPHFS
ncbi:hypothetical protein SCHPADRAFT_930341 [Schizopora paradoxa]|uniref:Uncharacterized protein n=1 Tax=Schizopora paradoxa TaxID=27342 RepID=A0A0H2RFS0_9AGAM|nr:hypothetical protein SCHPADRAFT_930341 [Schizopora paradoxa]